MEDNQNITNSTEERVENVNSQNNKSFKNNKNFKIIIGKNTIDGSVDRVLFDAVNSTTKIVIAAMNE